MSLLRRVRVTLLLMVLRVVRTTGLRMALMEEAIDCVWIGGIGGIGWIGG